MSTALVIENAPQWHLGHLADWLADAGADVRVIRPHAGEEIPAAADAEALIALGGGRGAQWTPELSALLSRAVAEHTPTLAFCSSARVLATAFDGTTAPVAEFRPGPALLARRDASTDDPLFSSAPMVLDVVAWRHEELREPPPAAVLLAASPHGAPEIFRLGDRAWGIQSHVEFDADMVRGLGGDDALAQRVAGIEEHLRDTWKPIVERFVALAEGRTAGTPLPLLPN